MTTDGDPSEVANGPELVRIPEQESTDLMHYASCDRQILGGGYMHVSGRSISATFPGATDTSREVRTLPPV